MSKVMSNTSGTFIILNIVHLFSVYRINYYNRSKRYLFIFIGYKQIGLDFTQNSTSIMHYQIVKISLKSVFYILIR